MTFRCFSRRIILHSAFMLVYVVVSSVLAKEPLPAPPDQNIQFTVTVHDSTDNSPIPLVRISLTKNGSFISGKVTDPQGKVNFRDVHPGWYRINFHDVGYGDFSDSIRIDASHTTYSAALLNINLGTVTVTAEHEATISSVDINTGQQVFESEDYHAPPTEHMTDLVQQNLAGAARAPTGEVHIRGQHGEFTYYVDGVPIPLGVFGGLNDIIDPKVIDRATFMTGGWPAEYGGQQTAVIDLQNRVPAGNFHLDASTYIGSYLVFNGASPFSPGANVPYGNSGAGPGDTLGGRVGPFRALNSDGQALSMSNHVGNFGYFISGSRQETDRRIDQPVVTLYNDHGLDFFLYGKFEYLIGDNDYITANLNFSKTNTEVPFDTEETGFSPDRQITANSFQTLSYYHTFNSDPDKESKLFVGLYGRQGGLNYMPSPADPVVLPNGTPVFTFAGNDTDYVLAENRTFSTLGIRTVYDDQISHEWKVSTGFNYSATTGVEQFSTRDSIGTTGPGDTSNYAGSDFGIFVQTEYHPVEWTRFDVGVRYDQHIAPDAPLQNQVSPRIRWNFFFDEANTGYLYFGRLFMPTNIEGLRTIESSQDTGSQSVPTLPERDDFWEATYLHSFDFGLKSKVSVYYKLATPGVDDETIGSSALKTPVNIAEVHTTGIEIALSYGHPTIPLVGYLNAAINHAYGSGAVSGGFLPISSDGIATDLDHDQRLSISAGITYQPTDWFVNFSTIYGSGLTNGLTTAYVVNGVNSYPTGLFNFNDSTHVPASIIFNLGGGYTFHLGGGATLVPSLFITNLFDDFYLLKGAYFSAASYGEPRNVVLNIAYHI